MDAEEDGQRLEHWNRPLKARYAKRRSDGQEGKEGEEGKESTESKESEEGQKGKEGKEGREVKQSGEGDAGGNKAKRSPIKGTNPWTFALNTGLFAGLLWGGIRIVEYYLKFTKVHPTFLIKPWSNPTFNQTNWGYLTGWAAFIVFSLVASLLYTLLFRKVKGPWTGLIYGFAWYVLLYIAVGPRTGMMKPIGKIDWNSLITDGSLFLLWGMFIGYTIAYEFNDEQHREPSVSLG